MVEPKIKKRTIKGVLALMKKNGYKINSRPYELNIIGIRTNNTEPNKFDDNLFVIYKNRDDVWEAKIYPITTDPGTYWLKNPIAEKGTAILKAGQYIDSYKLGLHRHEYISLVQQKPVTVWRDYDRNAVLDWDNRKEQTGLFGINIHRANKKGTTKTIDKYSAGCQVFANATGFDEFITLAQNHKDLYGNNFTYTLVDERAYIRALRRHGVYFGIAVITIAAFVGYRTYNNKKLFSHLKIFKDA